MASHEYALEKLAEILVKLEGLEPLPEAGTPEALADHDGWMKRHKEIANIERDAELAAMMTLPPEVMLALNKVRYRKQTLLNIPHWKEQWKQLQQEKGGTLQGE